MELAEKQLTLEMDKIKLDNILVNFLDPLLVIQKDYWLLGFRGLNGLGF